MNEEQKQNTRKLIEALRSGDYIQGFGALKEKSGDHCVHCCLGVASEILGVPSKPVLSEDNMFSFIYGEVKREGTPDQYWFNENYGWPNGFYYPFRVHGTPESVVSINDRGVPFDTIANIIEKEFFYEEYMAKQKAGD